MDRAKIEAFLDKFTAFLSGATTIGLLAVGDRSGLNSYLGENGGGTAADIAEGAGLEVRYVTEILSGLAAAGVVEYDSSTSVFTSPRNTPCFSPARPAPTSWADGSTWCPRS